MKSELIKHNFPKSEESFDVLNPANGKKVASLPKLSKADVKRTIKNAEKGFAKWRKTSVTERAKVLRKWHKLILQNKKELAKIMNAESGKLMAESLAEVEYAASFIDNSAEEALKVSDEIIANKRGGQGKVIKQPVGIVAAITPWNFPAAMITRKTAPALAVGCAVICKPASATPLTAIALLNLAYKAGIPKNVLQLVLGDAGMIADTLTENNKIRKLSFTGSTEIGKELYAKCAATMKRLTMELGGNAPFIVMEDADLNLAVEKAIASRFRFSGQTCICANRFLVHENIYDQFAKKFASKAKNLKLAPLINSKAVENVNRLMQEAVKDGAKLLCGGKFKDNHFEPTILRDVTPKMRIYNEEIFGPVATLIPFKAKAEVIKMANDTEYGLAGYIFSGNSKVAEEIAEKLEIGMIGINDNAVSSAYSPFGGFKHSGIGREGSHYGVAEYLEIKFIQNNS